MLSNSEIKRAKSLAFEYTVCTKELRIIQDRLNNHDLKPDVKERWQKEVTSMEQRQKDIETTFKKEFNVDLQKHQDSTPVGIISHVRKQQPEPELQQIISSPDRPQTLEKAPPISAWAVDPEKVAKGQKELAEKQPEPQKTEQPSKENTIFTATSTPPTPVEKGTLEKDYQQKHDLPQHTRPPEQRRSMTNFERIQQKYEQETKRQQREQGKGKKHEY